MGFEAIHVHDAPVRGALPPPIKRYRKSNLAHKSHIIND